MTLVPLADEHFEWQVELDSDVEVMRHLTGRACTREQVMASHSRRIAAAQKVDGLGFWIGPVERNTASRAVVERVGLTYVRTFPTSTAALVEGVEEGEVEYEMTREQWKLPRPSLPR